VGGLKGPPADELVVDKPDPEAESVHLLRECHPPRVAGLDSSRVLARPLRKRITSGSESRFDLPLEVLVP
jgi:hypothetical protein